MFCLWKWNSDTKSFDIDNNKIELLQTRSVNNMEHCKNALCVITAEDIV